MILLIFSSFERTVTVFTFSYAQEKRNCFLLFYTLKRNVTVFYFSIRFHSIFFTCKRQIADISSDENFPVKVSYQETFSLPKHTFLIYLNFQIFIRRAVF